MSAVIEVCHLNGMSPTLLNRKRLTCILQSHPDITKACALLIDGILCGYYVAPTQISCDALEAISSKTLPYYAIPSIWVWLPKMPLTPKG